jgi:hypothetical protein
MSFSDAIIQRVWEKGQIAPGNDPKLWRKDQCTAWIYRPAHGDRNSQYGWEIHHVNPNGGDDISNLIPLHWENNLATGDTGRLVCVVVSSGTQNVRRQ